MNSNTHRLGAAVTVASISAIAEQRQGQSTLKPLAHGTLAAFLGTLPDLIEPAYHPNHRQFFHSWTLAIGLGVSLYQVHKWQPENKFQECLKTLALVGGGAYLVHLAMDSTTPKSLPIF